MHKWLEGSNYFKEKYMFYKKKKQSNKKNEIERKNEISVSKENTGLPSFQKDDILSLKERNSNDSIVIINADGSLSPFANLIGGEIVDYEDIFLYINKMLDSLNSSNIDENAIFLANLLELLSDTTFSQAQQSKFICYIDEKFAQNEKLSLSSILAYMRLTLPKELEWICEITPDKQETEIFNKIVFFNLSKCPKSLLTAAYLLSLKMSFDIVSSNGEKWQYTWLSCNIDEIIKHPKTCSYLSSISKRMRTHWGVCSYYTHSLLDVYNMAPEILYNIITIFTYEPSEDDAKFICEKYLDSSVDLCMPGGIEPYLDCIFDMALQKKAKDFP